MRAIIGIGMLFLCGALTASGQGREQGRNYLFTCLPWDEQIAKQSLTFANGSRAVQVTEMNPLDRTDVYRWRGKGQLVFSTNGDIPTPETPAEELVRVSLPADSTRVLVVFMPDSKSPSKLRGVAFDDSVRNFPWGSYRLVNTTGMELGVVMGEDGKTKKKLPKGLKPVTIEPEGDPRRILTRIVRLKKPQEILYSGSWRFRKDNRDLVIIRHEKNARLGPLSIKTIPQRIWNLNSGGAARAN